MNAIKSGYRAEFQTAYLQREIRLLATVAGGIDSGLRNPEDIGYGVGRLVKITGSTDADRAVVAATGVTSTSIGDATHIIAQSDDTVREVPSDYNYPERYTTLGNLICKNSATPKTIAVYKIVNADDIKLVKISEPVIVLAGSQGALGGVNTKLSSISIVQKGINSYKVFGTAPYVSVPLVPGNPVGNYIYFKMINEAIKTADAFNAALSGVDSSAIVYKRVNGIDENTETKSAIASEIGDNGGIECEVRVNNTTQLEIDVMWEANVWSHYTFDLSDLKMEANA